MAELVDAHDSKSCSFGSAGSIPVSGTHIPPYGGIFYGIIYVHYQFNIHLFMKNTIIGLLAIGIIALVVVVVTNNNQQQQPQSGLDAFIQDINQSDQDIIQNEDTSSFESDLGQEQQGGNQMMTILLPKLVFAGEGWDIEYTPVEVPYSLGVMNAAYEAFFAQHDGVYNGLTYDSVDLSGGVAVVNLEGTYIPVGTMTDLYVREEINAVAFQFETVNAIEVRLHGNVWNWCDYDQSDANEGPCPQTPRFWIDVKN